MRGNNERVPGGILHTGKAGDPPQVIPDVVVRLIFEVGERQASAPPTGCRRNGPQIAQDIEYRC